MIHLALHVLVPLAVAGAFYRPDWLGAGAILLATMAVDVDHLLADPVYDPARCSIGFHPLHTAPAIAAWVGLFLAPAVARRRRDGLGGGWRVAHLVGLGLLLHMALDGIDCLVP